jgi:hypothetical protein
MRFTERSRGAQYDQVAEAKTILAMAPSLRRDNPSGDEAHYRASWYPDEVEDVT